MSRFRAQATPKCPRCNKSVYAAEQQIAIGKKWHIACFTCKSCKKRLDSTSLADKGGEIYCSSCYGKNFGPTGYGYGGGAGALTNTGKVRGDPVRSVTKKFGHLSTSPSSSPAKSWKQSQPKPAPTWQKKPVNASTPNSYGGGSGSVAPLPSRRGRGGFSPHRGGRSAAPAPTWQKKPVNASSSNSYGGGSGSSAPLPRRGRGGFRSGGRTSAAAKATSKFSSFGPSDNKCPRCNKTVYHAEQVLGGGHKWHQQCFKCPHCNKSLDSTNLVDHQGQVMCKACHGKNHGPKGYGFGGGAGALGRTVR